MSINNSTYDIGFNVVTPDFTALDSRYFKLSHNFSELTSSDPAYSIIASKHIFGSGIAYRLTDCTIRSSGSNSVLRFNTPTSSLGLASSWEGAIVYDTSAPTRRVHYAGSTKWIKLIDSDTDGIINANLALSSSGGDRIFSLTGSVGGEIAITNPSATSLFRISSSNDNVTIHHSRNVIFESGSNPIGEISTAGNLTFISGSVNFGNNSSNNTINGNLKVVGYLSASAISCSGDIIAFSTSDERLKDNLVPLTYNLQKLDLINGYNFDWKTESGRVGKDVGVLAQEIEKIMPEAVMTRVNGYKAVDYQKLIPFLIGCIKELKQKLDAK